MARSQTVKINADRKELKISDGAGSLRLTICQDYSLIVGVSYKKEEISFWVKKPTIKSLYLRLVKAAF